MTIPFPNPDIMFTIAMSFRDFPGGPMVKTPCTQFRGPGFDPWSGNLYPTCHNFLRAHVPQLRPGTDNYIF